MFEEDSSGVGTPNFDQTKARRLTLGDRQFNKCESHGKLSKAPKPCTFKVNFILGAFQKFAIIFTFIKPSLICL